MEPGRKRKREKWYLKLDPHFPRVSVSTDAIQRGNWAEDEVVNKYQKRE